MSDEAGGSHHAPPLRVTPEGVEAEPRKIGHRWLDLILAGSAILISVISLIVAIEHGHTMQQLVAANSWPLLQAGTSNITDAGKPVISIDLENVGVGPAVVKSFYMTYKGKRYDGGQSLLRECCGYSPAPAPPGQRREFRPGDPITSTTSRTVIRAGQTVSALRYELTDDNYEVWKRLNTERFKVAYRACYCSVFDTCWQSDLSGIDPKEVKACPAG